MDKQRETRPDGVLASLFHQMRENSTSHRKVLQKVTMVAFSEPTLNCQLAEMLPREMT